METSEMYRSIGMLGKEVGYQISTCQCNIMQITRKLIKKIHASYMELTVLENVESIKYLGVTITNDLMWNSHVNTQVWDQLHLQVIN